MKKSIFRKVGVWMMLSVFGLCALGSGEATESEKQEIVAASENEDAGAKEEASEETSDTNSDFSIEEQVLLDQDGIKVTATGVENDVIYGTGIKLLLENNSDKNVTVGCNALIVNDYMISDLFVADVAAGKKANETMYMMSSELDAAGISNIGQIEIYFHVYDSTSYDTIFDSDVVTIQTSKYAEMDKEAEAEDDGFELCNQDGIRIVGKYVDENSFWGTAVLLYIENTSGKNVGISCEDMSINGFMVTPVFSATVYDGKKALDEITIMSSDLEANGITSVDDIELNFHVYDETSYETLFDTGAISFSVNGGSN